MMSIFESIQQRARQIPFFLFLRNFIHPSMYSPRHTVSSFFFRYLYYYCKFLFFFFFLLEDTFSDGRYFLSLYFFLSSARGNRYDGQARFSSRGLECLFIHQLHHFLFLSSSFSFFFFFFFEFYIRDEISSFYVQVTLIFSIFKFHDNMWMTERSRRR